MTPTLNPNLQPSIFIYGPLGSGKSTLGQFLADSLNLPFYDLNEMIKNQAETSIPEIFSEENESGFREREFALLKKVLEDVPGVIALEGGTLVNPDNRNLVQATGPIIYLTAPVNTLLVRSLAQEEQRPILLGDISTRFQHLLDSRANHYATFDIRLDTSEISLESAVWEAQVLLGIFHVSGMGASYDVRVAAGGLEKIGGSLHARGLGGPIAVVTDDNVGSLYAKRILDSFKTAGYQARVITIRVGETNKTVDTLGVLWNGLLEAQVERGSTVVALGGGVVGDLAGFAAATYMRGVPWVVAPTSLLAMVDASMGGKTGVDLPQGKNLVGAFHPPSLVLADPEALSSLPKDELRNGMAEVVKHGVIGDPKLFDLCSQGWEVLAKNWDEVVRRGMAVKVRVIQEDPYEQGSRAALNLGHTLGHSIELVSGFRLKHGEAVAVGMVAAARLAERIGLAERDFAENLSAVLSGLGLPTEVPAGMDRDQILDAMRHDKKRRGGKTQFVLPASIGDVRWGIEVKDQEIQSILK